tara:strand:- start:220 stop:519 length:300 start_codon:yes stop_codon:yes gene_type:complete
MPVRYAEKRPGHTQRELGKRKAEAAEAAKAQRLEHYYKTPEGQAELAKQYEIETEMWQAISAERGRGTRGGRKTNKRKTNKRKTNKRKTNKRKTNKRKN